MTETRFITFERGVVVNIVDEEVIGLENTVSDIPSRNVCMFWYIDSLYGIRRCPSQLMIKTRKISDIAHWSKRRTITYPEGHIMLWEKWVKEFGLVFNDRSEVTNYMYYPRGRVSYLKEYEYGGSVYKDVFELVMDKCLTQNNTLIDNILLGHCRLSKAEDTIFIVSETEVNDEHYICHRPTCGNQKRRA